ncbi:MAG: c-type cytochrome [Myxococcota bacterium]
MKLAALALLAAAFLAGRAAAEDPRVLYLLHCQGCHLADGSGSPGAVPSLVGVARFATLPEGRAYLVGVPGSAQAPIGDAELAAVLNWMLAAFGPADVAAQLEPFGEEEVARLRIPLADVGAVRAQLIDALAGKGPAPDAKNEQRFQ